VKHAETNLAVISHHPSGVTPQERRPTGSCPGTPSLQHLHRWLAKHRLQKVCISWRPSNHACWWRPAGSGRGTRI